MKKLSIIIPAYNCEKYISGCLDPLVAELDADSVEIIVVNDGSTDGTGKLLAGYGDKIQLISKVNGGASAARNTALEVCTGEFVMFCDSDDLLPPETVKAALEKQSLSGADIVRFSYRLTYPDGLEKAPFNYFTEERFVKKSEFPEYIYKYFLSGIRLNSVWATLYRHEVIKDIRFRTDIRTAEDAVFSAQAYTNAESVLLVPDIYYFYYQTKTGLTGVGLKVKEKYRCNFIVSENLIAKLPEWGMNKPRFRLTARLRPLLLSFNKVKRLLFN